MSGLNDGRIIDADPFFGTDKYYEIDGQYYIENTQDVAGLIERNKAEFNNVDERARFKKESFNKVASIPMTIYADLERRGIIQDQKRLRRWLNDRDNMVFRTRPGKL